MFLEAFKQVQQGLRCAGELLSGRTNRGALLIGDFAGLGVPYQTVQNGKVIFNLLLLLLGKLLANSCQCLFGLADQNAAVIERLYIGLARIVFLLILGGVGHHGIQQEGGLAGGVGHHHPVPGTNPADGLLGGQRCS